MSPLLQNVMAVTTGIVTGSCVNMALIAVSASRLGVRMAPARSGG